MMIERISALDEPDRFPAALVGVPPPAPGSLPLRSQWPVDDAAALFLVPLIERGGHDPVEVTNWRAFDGTFPPGAASDWARLAVRGYFVNGGRRAVILPYREQLGPDTLDVAAAIDGVATVVTPGLHGDDDHPVAPERAAELQRELVVQSEQRGDRIVLVDPPLHLDIEQVRHWRLETFPVDSWCAACYHPWIAVVDTSGRTVFVPPSGHIAGLLAYSDLRYGVHKPPANEPIRGATNLAGGSVSPLVGDVLNPIGVNLIVARQEGMVLWGARSMSSDPDQRLLDDCRSLQFIVRLVRIGTSWLDASTESPDDLWRQLHHDLTALVDLLRQSGVLRATRPESGTCVRREGERTVLLEVPLTGSLGTPALRLHY